MWATDVTFIAGTDVGSTTNQSADQITKDGITIKSTSAGLAYAEYRFYNGTITISSTVGTITGYTKNVYSVDKPLELPDDLSKQYNVYGILDNYNGTPQIIPLGFEDENGVITSIETLNSDIKKVLYYNMQGIESTKPFNGINIIVKTYSDGSQVVTKELRK